MTCIRSWQKLTDDHTQTIPLPCAWRSPAASSTRVAHKLLSELGDINTLFAASTSTIAGIAGDAVARALTTAPDGTAASLIDAALAWLNEAEDQHLLTWAHPAFPALLLESGDAPVILFARAGSTCSSGRRWQWSDHATARRAVPTRRRRSPKRSQPAV